jgi:hypothetical protein
MTPLLDFVQQTLTTAFLVAGFVWVITWLIKTAAGHVADAVTKLERARQATVPEGVDGGRQSIVRLLIPYLSIIAVIVLSVVIGCVLLWSSSGQGVVIDVEDEGLVLRKNDPDANFIPYYTASLYINEIKKQQIPLVDCFYHHAIDTVHLGVLKSPRQEATDAVAVKTISIVSPYAVDKTREEARTLCVADAKLPGKYFNTSDAIFMMKQQNFIPLNAWNGKRRITNISWIEHALITAILLSENGTRYARVVSAFTRQDVYTFEPQILNLELFLETVTSYYNQMVDYSRTHRLLSDPPCLCMPHFGIVGSGLFLRYHDHQWQLILHPNVTRNLTRPGTVTHIDYGIALEFPYFVDALYNVDEVTHYNRIEVQYIDLSGPIDPNDILGIKKVNDVLGIKALLLLAEEGGSLLFHHFEDMIQSQEWTGDEVACFYHCSSIEERFTDSIPEDINMYSFW